MSHIEDIELMPDEAMKNSDYAISFPEILFNKFIEDAEAKFPKEANWYVFHRFTRHGRHDKEFRVEHMRPVEVRMVGGTYRFTDKRKATEEARELGLVRNSVFHSHPDITFLEDKNYVMDLGHPRVKVEGIRPKLAKLLQASLSPVDIYFMGRYYDAYRGVLSVNDGQATRFTCWRVDKERGDLESMRIRIRRDE